MTNIDWAALNKERQQGAREAFQPPPLSVQPSEAVQDAPGGLPEPAAVPPPLPGSGDQLAGMLAYVQARTQRAFRETTCTAAEAIIPPDGTAPPRIKLRWGRAAEPLPASDKPLYKSKGLQGSSVAMAISGLMVMGTMSGIITAENQEYVQTLLNRGGELAVELSALAAAAYAFWGRYKAKDRLS